MASFGHDIIFIVNNDIVKPFFVLGGASMPEKKKLPVGIDNFEKIIKNNFYYVDKTEILEKVVIL